MEKLQQYIIVDLMKETALYGFGGNTLKFSNKDSANEFASQIFESSARYSIVKITSNPN